jgi:hypothetical protein
MPFVKENPSWQAPCLRWIEDSYEDNIPFMRAYPQQAAGNALADGFTF